MVYKFRITLAGLKGFFRVYRVDGSNSLYTFHKQIRSDLEFAMDQPVLFKGLDDKDEVVARYALTDLGFGTIDSVSVADALKAGIQSFIYFYDIKSKKSVIITLEEEMQGHISLPQLDESKGPVPLAFEQGYVAFEDLPKDKRRIPGIDDGDDEEYDEDYDEDEEEDEEDDEEIIYDEKD